MNREDIIRMARDAKIWLQDLHYGYEKIDEHLVDGLERFAALVAAAEREACAKVCEGRLQHGLNFEGCAAAIRARGNT